MKKLLSITVLSLLTLLNINSQTKGSFELGANAGVNFATVAADGQTTNSLTAFNFGAVGEYYFSEEWGIKAKLTYDGKGWADGFFIDENNNTSTTDFQLNYLTLPIMANWHFGSTKKWYLSFGLYAGFLIDARLSANNRDVSETFQSTDFGFAFGLGYKFPIDEKTKLFFDVDGQGALTGVFKELSPGTSTIKNSRTAINFGALFDL